LGPRREEGRRWNKFHDELYNLIIILIITIIVSYIIITLILIKLQIVLHCLPNIFTMVNSKRVKWTGNIAHIREIESIYKILIKKLKGGSHLVEPGIDRRILLNFINRISE
jgi:hypothetical protein